MNDAGLRIFVSSPSDVDHERALVKDVIEQLGQEYLPYFRLQPILWEEEALTADRTFQAGLTQPRECDIVLVILWARLGSPLPQEPYRGMTGTEWEFISAVEASLDQGIPEVLVYKKVAPRLVDVTDAEAAAEAVTDRQRLEGFFRQHFFHADNTFRRAFRTFENDTELRELLELQLRKLLNRRISIERRAHLGGGMQWQGSPFRPDRPFEQPDARVFAGRERELRELIGLLAERGPDDPGCLVLSGPSGCGKTSLLRAGLVPRLGRPFLFEGIAQVHCVSVEPSGRGPSPIEALAAALLAGTALGDDLHARGLDADGLRQLLVAEPELAARQIAAAIARSRAGDDPDATRRLMLIVDPLDVLLEPGSATEAVDRQQSVAAVLAALARQRWIWVLLALREDALPRMPRGGALNALVRNARRLRLAAPAPASLRQVIEIPARVAGISLDEPDAERVARGLVEQIEADAAHLEHWQVPVQAALDAAYQAAAAEDRRNDAGELLLGTADYLRQGGLAGQVLARADACWASLDDEARARLPMLCRALLRRESVVSGHCAPREGDPRVLGRDPACARLLEALIAARLVTTDALVDPIARVDCGAADASAVGLLRTLWRQGQDEWRARRRRREVVDLGEPDADRPTVAAGSGNDDDRATDDDRSAPDLLRPTAVFSHPVLWERWQPLRAWLAEPSHRRQLVLRGRLTRQAQLWHRTDCNADYLLRAAGYAELVPLAAAIGPELEPQEHALLRHSAAHLAYLRRRNQLVMLVGLMLMLFLLAASASALLAWRANDQARVNLSRSQLKEADLYIARGNSPQAVNQAIEAGPHLPAKAVQTLSQAFSNNRLLAMATTPGIAADQPRVPGLDARGALLATLEPSGRARRWRLSRGRYVADRDLDGRGLGLHSLVIDADGTSFGIAEGGVWRLPAAVGAVPDYACGARAGAEYSLDSAGRHLALARADGGVCVLDLRQSGRLPVQLDLDEGELRDLNFDPSGTALITASEAGRSHVIGLEDGSIQLSLPTEGPLGRPFNAAVFDATGARIGIAAVDERVRLYRRDGTALGELATAQVGGRAFKMHNSAVRDLAFGAAGEFLVAVDDEGQVVRWSLDGLGDEGGPASGEAMILGRHGLSVERVAIVDPPTGELGPASDGESLVLSASLDGTARLWGLQTGEPIAVLGHDGAIHKARFVDAGRRVATYSNADGTTRLWSVAPVSRLAHQLDHADHVWNVALAAAPLELAPEGQALLLATAGFDGGVRVWRYRRDIANAEPVELSGLERHQAPVRQVQFSADARLMVSAANDGTALVQNLVTGRHCRLAVTASDQGQVFNALVDPDGDWLLTTSDDPVAPVRLFSVYACAPIDAGPAIEHPAAPVAAAVLLDSPDGILVATGDQAGTVRLLRLRPNGGWQRVCELGLDMGPIGAIAIAADGKAIAAAGGETAALIAVDEAGCRGGPPLLGHAGNIYSIAFSGDGELILTGALDKTARLWDRNGRPRAVLRGHRDRIYRVAFGPAPGIWMLTASRDGDILLWRRPDRLPEQSIELEAYLPLSASLGGVANAQFSPDGHYIAGAYWDDAALLWRIWIEADEAPPARARQWGRERARLSLIEAAYQFRDDNRIDVVTGSAEALGRR
jgi:WD40 repeat protein